MPIQNDGDKYYLIEGGQVVAAANSKEALVEKNAESECGCDCEGCAGEHCYGGNCSMEKKKGFTINDRVELNGRLGTIKTIVTSVYGDVAGIKLDNGSTEEVLVEALSHTEAEEPTYETAVDALVAEFDTYTASIVTGIDEVRRKAASARSLNLRAKAIVTDPKLSFSDRVKLDKMVLTTGVDIVELREDEQALASADYIEEQPRFEMALGTSVSRLADDDASWLLDSAEQAQEDHDSTDWDGFLAHEAVALVSRMSDVLIEDDTYVTDAITQAFASLGAENGRLAQFKQNVGSARTARISKIQDEAAQRVASVEEDDTPFEALFL